MLRLWAILDCFTPSISVWYVDARDFGSCSVLLSTVLFMFQELNPTVFDKHAAIKDWTERMGELEGVSAYLAERPDHINM